jgi:hypothetical protein
MTTLLQGRHSVVLLIRSLQNIIIVIIIFFFFFIKPPPSTTSSTLLLSSPPCTDVLSFVLSLNSYLCHCIALDPPLTD